MRQAEKPTPEPTGHYLRLWKGPTSARSEKSKMFDDILLLI